jgi:hypothetical protein
MLAFITGLAIGIVLGNVGLLAVLAWLDVTGDTRNVTRPAAARRGPRRRPRRGPPATTLARCSDMPPQRLQQPPRPARR